MIDDRVWTVRFRRELADALRERAGQEGLTVQQVIVRSVADYLGSVRQLEESPAVAPEKADQDLYQYGGGPATPPSRE